MEQQVNVLESENCNKNLCTENMLKTDKMRKSDTFSRKYGYLKCVSFKHTTVIYFWIFFSWHDLEILNFLRLNLPNKVLVNISKQMFRKAFKWQYTEDASLNVHTRTTPWNIVKPSKISKSEGHGIFFFKKKIEKIKVFSKYRIYDFLHLKIQMVIFAYHCRKEEI